MNNNFEFTEMWCVARFGSIFTKLKNVKNTHEGVSILVKLQAKVCNFTKINSPPWVFFTFFKLYKCYQIAQRIRNGWKEMYSHLKSQMLTASFQNKCTVNGLLFIRLQTFQMTKYFNVGLIEFTLSL